MIINYNSGGTYSIGKDGGINYTRHTQDGHGGRAAEHREEMEQVAEEIAERKIENKDITQALSISCTQFVNPTGGIFKLSHLGIVCKQPLPSRAASVVKSAQLRCIV